jgi:O-antigen ligase
MKLSLSRKLFYFFPVLFCFCLPFGSLLLSAIIVLWTLCSFFNISRETFVLGLRNRLLWLCYLFFICTFVSAIFSDNKEEVLFAVEIKMSFLLFPYLLFCFRWPMPLIKRCIVSFVSGCFFASVYLILRALLFSINGQPEYFYYTMFSDFIHASYFSMYLMLAVIFTLLLYPRWFQTQKSIIYSSYFFIAIFIATIFLCSSKLGIISFFTCVPLLFLYKWRRKLSLKLTVYFVTAFLFAIFIGFKMLPGPFSRLNTLRNISFENIDRTSAESTTVRLLIWEQCIDLIIESPIAGHGVADANDELYRKYEYHGLTGASEHKLNAHNQFFQTSIGMGLSGSLLLFALTFWQLIAAAFRRRIILFLFSLLIIMNFMVESMLQASAGVLFFVFFLCLLRIADEKELAADAGMDVEALP